MLYLSPTNPTSAFDLIAAGINPWAPNQFSANVLHIISSNASHASRKTHVLEHLVTLPGELAAFSIKQPKVWPCLRRKYRTYVEVDQYVDSVLKLRVCYSLCRIYNDATLIVEDLKYYYRQFATTNNMSMRIDSVRILLDGS